MSFKRINLKIAYSSDTDDILNDFYIPVLEESFEYLRLAGYFSSSSLALSARGILGLIKNNGNMKLIISPILNKQDLDIIVESREYPEKYFEQKILNDLTQFEDQFVRDHTFALGWMIANHRLEIKIAVPDISCLLPMVTDDEKFHCIFHQKVGIFNDNAGNIVSFSGSVNETFGGWSGNIEEFKVFWSWDPQLDYYVDSDLEKFRKFWDNKSQRIKVYNLPDAVEQRLIQIAPKNLIELNLASWNLRKPPKKIILHDYQNNAVQSWLNNRKMGIFEMATGSGKTYTSLDCLRRTLYENKRIFVVISCPFIHLIDQWKKNLEDFNLIGIKVHGGKWKKLLVNSVLNFNLRYSNQIIIITSHDTLCSNYFIDSVSKIEGKSFLIADEVHSLGSEQRRKGLLSLYNYRLGLSATPIRWFDDEGTKIIKNFFGDIIFKYSLNDAIKGGFLTPYEYHPDFIDLTPNELEEYEILSKKIVNKFKINEGDIDDYLEQLLFIRQNLIKNAENKYSKFIDIIKRYQNESHCLIYCSPQQIKRIQTILNELGLINHRFTAHENLKQRKEILQLFESGGYPFLVAMNCLDEGVDVPATQLAIILASSGNPRQYIQRRGRILRKFPGKEKAIIHDLIVIPNVMKKYDPYLFELERKILKKELIRYEEFSETALNSLEALNKIYPYLDQFDVYGSSG